MHPVLHDVLELFLPWVSYLSAAGLWLLFSVALAEQDYDPSSPARISTGKGKYLSWAAGASMSLWFFFLPLFFTTLIFPPLFEWVFTSALWVKLHPILFGKLSLFSPPLRFNGFDHNSSLSFAYSLLMLATYVVVFYTSRVMGKYRGDLRSYLMFLLKSLLGSALFPFLGPVVYCLFLWILNLAPFALLTVILSKIILPLILGLVNFPRWSFSLFLFLSKLVLVLLNGFWYRCFRTPAFPSFLGMGMGMTYGFFLLGFPEAFLSVSLIGLLVGYGVHRICRLTEHWYRPVDWSILCRKRCACCGRCCI